VFEPRVAAVSVVVSTIVAAGAAWLPVRPLLKHTPMEMFRRLKSA